MDRIKEYLKKHDIELTQTMEQQFHDYYKLLITWNEKMNLTAITDYDLVVTKHFIDSLSLIEAVDLNTRNTMIDIGTGAGFPGIPLKIVFPHLKVTLLDSLSKRIQYLKQVIEELSLFDIEALHGRAEDYAKEAQYREQYDICVSRAVANISTLSEYCMPYIRVGGIFTPHKSGIIEDELEKGMKAIKILGGYLYNTKYFELDNTEIKRSIIVIKKIENTNAKYPRKAPLPSKKPLL